MIDKKDYALLCGAWEEPGVIGTRLEIGRGALTVLWRNAPVLETPYSLRREEDGRLVLRLRKTGLRYAGAAEDYGAVTALYLLDGKLAVNKKGYAVLVREYDEEGNVVEERKYDEAGKEILE